MMKCGVVAVMKRTVKIVTRLRLRAEAVRLLTAANLQAVQGGRLAHTKGDSDGQCCVDTCDAGRTCASG